MTLTFGPPPPSTEPAPAPSPRKRIWQPPWTPERDEVLIALIAMRYSAGMIADKLGFLTHCKDGGRSAVLGRISRLRAAGKIAQTQTMARVEKPRKPRATATFAERPREPIAPRAAPVISDDEIPMEQRKHIWEMDNTHCRWPLGQENDPAEFFCAAPGCDVTGGIPYCTAFGHSARAYGQSSYTPEERARFALERRRAGPTQPTEA